MYPFLFHILNGTIKGRRGEMREGTQRRYELMAAIVEELGKRGRDMRINDLKPILKSRFINQYQDERYYYLSVDSQIRLLEGHKLVRVTDTIVGLTPDGLKAYEKGGLKKYLKEEERENRINTINSIFSIAASAVGVIAFISAYLDNAEKNVYVVWLCGFIVGLATSKLIQRLISTLSRFRSLIAEKLNV